ncbi:hypothetical protein B0T16DRAFT_494041 [Cercophora newfieldiana]|uniref:Uncharacterized protein n=1 Tax=Cercophora newfieldiana TaxID=92897 RepID=A0AA40CMI9_9PEZI|nr:hypothetical protein B0T16DRAFT_494041 [Cercophora newfieldiana]
MGSLNNRVRDVSAAADPWVALENWLGSGNPVNHHAFGVGGGPEDPLNERTKARTTQRRIDEATRKIAETDCLGALEKLVLDEALTRSLLSDNRGEVGRYHILEQGLHHPNVGYMRTRWIRNYRQLSLAAEHRIEQNRLDLQLLQSKIRFIRTNAAKHVTDQAALDSFEISNDDWIDHVIALEGITEPKEVQSIKIRASDIGPIWKFDSGLQEVVPYDFVSAVPPDRFMAELLVTLSSGEWRRLRSFTVACLVRLAQYVATAESLDIPFVRATVDAAAEAAKWQITDATDPSSLMFRLGVCQIVAVMVNRWPSALDLSTLHNISSSANDWRYQGAKGAGTIMMAALDSRRLLRFLRAGSPSEPIGQIAQVPPGFYLMVNISARTVQAVTEPRFPIQGHDGMTAVVHPNRGLIIEPEDDTRIPWWVRCVGGTLPVLVLQPH